MNEVEYRRRYQDRESRYPGWEPLPEDCCVHIHVDPVYASTYAGQVATITSASLLGRMSKSIAVDVPPVPLVRNLPWSGTRLDEVVLRTLNEIAPSFNSEVRPALPDDLRVVIGPSGDGLIVHGNGWDSYVGNGISPISLSYESNPFGAAFAVVAAASRMHRVFQGKRIEPLMIDTYRWRTGAVSMSAPEVVPDFSVGELWCVGVGSVGSCALFFLSLGTRDFNAVLVDGDTVKVENVSRSALFSHGDATRGKFKVCVAEDWLRAAGVRRIEPYAEWLDEIPQRWLQRSLGTPDVVISAANERNVRQVIEAGFPPLQVYGTTGLNLQATLFRHIPIKEPCALCVPGGKPMPLPTPCATGPTSPIAEEVGEDDVALPFLSYAAGLMTAAEIAKLALTGQVATRNRVFFDAGGPLPVKTVALNRKIGCVCGGRDDTVHLEAIQGSRFATMSEIPKQPEGS